MLIMTPSLSSAILGTLALIISQSSGRPIPTEPIVVLRLLLVASFSTKHICTSGPPFLWSMTVPSPPRDFKCASIVSFELPTAVTFCNKIGIDNFVRTPFLKLLERHPES